jgi:hypothetical protein
MARFLHVVPSGNPVSRQCGEREEAKEIKEATEKEVKEATETGWLCRLRHSWRMNWRST